MRSGETSQNNTPSGTLNRGFGDPAGTIVSGSTSTAVAIPWNGTGRAFDFAADAAGEADGAGELAFFSAAKLTSGAQTRAALTALLINNVLFFIVLISDW